MKQTHAQKLESDCGLAYICVQNEMSLVAFYEFVFQVSSNALAKLKEVEESQKLKEEEKPEVIEPEIEVCPCQ